MQYTPAQEVQMLHDLFNKPIPIIAACNRVQAQEKRSKAKAWWRGVFWGLGSVAVVFGLVMAIGWLAE